MVNVRNKRCSEDACLKHPSYGVAGSKKAEFCSEHARVGMVNVVTRKCSDDACLKSPSYGVAGSKKAEFCSEHARAGMVTVRNKRCRDERCLKHASYGVARSEEAEFCSEHARAGMMDVVTRKCSDDACLKSPSYGVAGSKKAEFCSEHARVGMVNVVGRMCGHEDCLKFPTFCVPGSKRRAFCAEHATAGMVNVKIRYHREACLKHPTYGVVGSEEAEFCSNHARTGVVGIENVKSGKNGSSESCISKGHNVDDSQFCQQHTTTPNTPTVHDAAKLNTTGATSSRSPTVVGGFVADIRGKRRKRAGCSGSSSCAVVGTRRCVCPSHGRGCTTLSLRSAQIISGAHGQVSSEARAGAGIKVETAVAFPAHCGTCVSDRRVQGTCSSDSSSVGAGKSSSNSSGVGTGWLYDSSAVVSGCLGAFDNVQAEEAEVKSNMKLEPRVSSFRSWTSDR
ncbi:unnamed protein product [Sphacelaria rigidula]